MAKSIVTSLVHFAADEGREAALEQAQKMQLALEQLWEIGSSPEAVMAAELLRRVNRAIKEITETNAVELVKTWEMGEEQAEAAKRADFHKKVYEAQRKR